MNLSRRIEKLERMAVTPNDQPFTEIEYQVFEDWYLGDPMAKELFEKHEAYAREKDYPQHDMEFYDTVEDPEFWRSGKAIMDAFGEYLKAREGQGDVKKPDSQIGTIH